MQTGWFSWTRRLNSSLSMVRPKNNPQTSMLGIELLERREMLSAAAAATAEWKFVVYGDSRDDYGGIDTAILGELANQTVAEGAKFVLFTGDLAGMGSLSNFQTWKSTMAPAYNAGIGVYPIMGNHDANDADDFQSLFIQPNVASNLYTVDAAGRSFSFNYNNALFLGLDSYEPGNSDQVNQAFVDQQLAARDRGTTPLVFAFGHEPAFRVGPDEGLEQYPSQRDAFWSSLENAGSRAYFAGHDHLYDHLRLQENVNDNPNNDVHQFTVGTAGAPLYTYDLSGDMGNWAPSEQYHESQYGYLLVDVNGNTVTMTWKHRTDTNTYAATSDVFSYTVNAPPVAVNDNVTTAKNTAATIHVLTNDSDPDRNPLTVASATGAQHGTVTIGAGNTVIYTPALNYIGADSFRYTISDGDGGSASAVVNIQVTAANALPIAVNNAVGTQMSKAVTFNVLTNDRDPDGDRLTVVNWTKPSYGTLVYNGTGSFTFTPKAGYSGTTTFQYTIGDGRGGRATATVSIKVTPANRLPIAVNNAASTLMNQAVTFNVLTNDRDPDRDRLTVVSWTRPSYGTLVYHGAGSFTFTPRGWYYGTTTFQYTIGDGRGGRASAVVSIKVTRPQTSGVVALKATGSGDEEVDPLAALLASDLVPGSQSQRYSAVDQAMANWQEIVTASLQSRRTACPRTAS